ncbi:hypothetical protein [Roseateles sp.]|uniref:hypothetical protein n=1 Tax=Roseateles sp. TaxID=1971397 RepID=UPI00326548B6
MQYGLNTQNFTDAHIQKPVESPTLGRQKVRPFGEKCSQVNAFYGETPTTQRDELAGSAFRCPVSVRINMPALGLTRLHATPLTILIGSLRGRTRKPPASRP